MANFVQTMKDWRRMCMAMEKLRPDDSCCGCPLEGYGCPAIYEDNSHVDYNDVEKNVMSWAAEHPEPVYPTWLEWMHSMGLVLDAGISDEKENYMLGLTVRDPIPADIAQKLGIEPKK